MTDAPPVDTARLFDLLADDARRRLLVQLCDSDAVGIPGDLLIRGETRTGSAPIGGPSHGAVLEAAPRESLAVEMHHEHLPMLESHGLVRWDREDGTVLRGPVFGEVEPFLRLLSAHAGALPSGLL